MALRRCCAKFLQRFGLDPDPQALREVALARHCRDTRNSRDCAPRCWIHAPQTGKGGALEFRHRNSCGHGVPDAVVLPRTTAIELVVPWPSCTMWPSASLTQRVSSRRASSQASLIFVHDYDLPNPGLPNPGFGRAIRLAEPWVAEPWVAEPWVAEPWVAEPRVRSSDSTRRTLGCRTLGCRTLGCRTLGSVERFDSPNPGLPNPGLPNPGLPNPGSVERFPRCERAHRRRVALRRASVEVQRATASVRAEIRDRSSGAREPECNRFGRGAWISPCAALGRAVNPPKKKVHPRAHQCESARVRVQPLMNASRSGFTTSGCVVHMPCGSFG